MKKKLKGFLISLMIPMVALISTASTTGCASGGFKLTRQLARWVNSKHLIIRIILYIFGSVVFGITLVIDAVVFNTIDFWEGKVSAGDYQFTKGDATYLVSHSIEPKTNLKKSTVKVMDKKNTLIHTRVLAETLSGQIEVFVDGKLKARISNVKDIPVADIFDGKGNLVSQQPILESKKVAGL